MSDYDHWLLPTECKVTKAYREAPEPDHDTLCINCNQPILDTQGNPVSSYDTDWGFDPEWGCDEWYYWHEHC